jgi:peroxiredoxin
MASLHTQAIKQLVLLGLFVCCLFSCEQKHHETHSIQEKTKEITSSFLTFWDYWNNEINLCDSIVAVDTLNRALPKGKFIDLLSTGAFIPILIENDNIVKRFRLARIPEEADKTISATVKQMVGYEQLHLRLENKSIAPFKFKDINEVEWNKNSLKGWFTIIKTWFIKCGPCEEQRPAFEALMHKYQKQNVRFLSLADDSRADLIRFNDQHDVQFAIVPEQSTFIRETLGLSTYPSYILIDPSGVILKVSNDLSCIERQLVANGNKLNNIPPPPQSE